MKATRSPQRKYLPLLSQLDAWQHRAQLDHPGVIPCRSGCHACCKGPFDISVADVELVIEGIARLSPTVAGRVVATASEHLAIAREREPSWSAPFAIADLGEERFDRLSNGLAELPCPMLDENGACSIYDHRPMVCRLMGLGLEAEDGYVVENGCPIQQDYPAYASLGPIQFRLMAWEEHEDQAKQDAAQRLFGDRSFADFETTIAGAVALAAGRPSLWSANR